MKVINEIRPREINGVETHWMTEERRLIVESHWNYNDRIHLKFGDLDLLVSTDDLTRAIINTRNHRGCS